MLRGMDTLSGDHYAVACLLYSSHVGVLLDRAGTPHDPSQHPRSAILDAVCKAARFGVRLDGSTMYVRACYDALPRLDEAQAIVEAGVARFVRPVPLIVDLSLIVDPLLWSQDRRTGEAHLVSGGVKIVDVAHRCPHPYQAWHSAISQFLPSEESVMLPCAVVGCPAGIDSPTLTIAEPVPLRSVEPASRLYPACPYHHSCSEVRKRQFRRGDGGWCPV